MCAQAMPTEESASQPSPPVFIHSKLSHPSSTPRQSSDKKRERKPPADWTSEHVPPALFLFPLAQAKLSIRPPSSVPPPPRLSEAIAGKGRPRLVRVYQSRRFHVCAGTYAPPWVGVPVLHTSAWASLLILLPLTTCASIRKQLRLPHDCDEPYRARGLHGNMYLAYSRVYGDQMFLTPDRSDPHFFIYIFRLRYRRSLILRDLHD